MKNNSKRKKSSQKGKEQRRMKEKKNETIKLWRSDIILELRSRLQSN